MTQQPHWTHAGKDLPWLRGQGFHVAAEGTERVVFEALVAHDFTVTDACTTSVDLDARFGKLAESLRLPDTAHNNLDAMSDSLRDLPERWKETSRLALLWSGVEPLLYADLLAFTQLGAMLTEANSSLWIDRTFVLETVAFVGPPFHADRP